MQGQCREVISSAAHYQALESWGLQYGPSFQGVEQLWRQDGEAIGQLRLPEVGASEGDAYQVHPAFLDACFQVLIATLPKEDTCIAEGDTSLPVGLVRLQLYDHLRPGTGLWSHALLRPGTEAKTTVLEGDVFLLDKNEQVVLEAQGLRLQRLDSGTRRVTQQDLSDWLYEVQWRPTTRLRPDRGLGPLPPDQRGTWLICADSSGVGQTLEVLLEARGETCVLVTPGETYQHTALVPCHA